MRKRYPTDLSEDEWSKIADFFKTNPKKGGRPSKHSRKEIVDAIFYILSTGCSWRLLPHDFPPWQTVYSSFRHWQNLEIWEEMNAMLRKQWRIKQGRNEEPTGGIVDSQSVKTTEKGGSKDMTEVKRLKEEKGIYWWIHKEFCLQLV
jgi:putative transposase